MTPEQKHIPATPERTPRISVNKMAEYLATASVTKRRAILREQKFPKESEFKSTWYDEARTPIKKCFTISTIDPTSISNKIHKLQNEIADLNHNSPETAEEQRKHKIKIQRKESCLEAMEIFLENIPLLEQYKSQSFLKNPHQGHITLNSVKISVEPDVVINGTIRKKSYTGAIKLYFSKSTKLTGDMGKTISSIIYKLLSEHYDNVDSKHCFVYDVINSTIYSASNNFTKKLSEVEDACEDIKALWPNIKSAAKPIN